MTQVSVFVGRANGSSSSSSSSGWSGRAGLPLPRRLFTFEGSRGINQALIFHRGVASRDASVRFCRQGQRFLFFQLLFRMVRKGRPSFAGRGRTAVEPGSPGKNTGISGNTGRESIFSRPFLSTRRGSNDAASLHTGAGGRAFLFEAGGSRAHDQPPER